jgi:LemA protein
MEPILIIGIAILAVIIIFLIATYNSFIRLKNEVDNSFSQIDVQLKRRNDLIPNLVETVKGYARHEKQLFENVTKARAAVVNASSMSEKARASNMLTDALKSVFAVAESYPALRANENFKQLQEELTATEDKISYSRQYYNDRVMVLNTRLETFPFSVIGSMFKFAKKELFKAAEEERKPVKVAF